MVGKTAPYLLFACSSFLMASCATLEKREVVVVPSEKPQVSRVLEEPQKRFLKRKVAIARFSNETGYGQGFFADESSKMIGKQATDILSAKLTATGKLILLERADYDKINQELKQGGLENLKIPADYLIVGSISEFGRKTTSDVGILSRVKKQSAYAKVYVRLIDVETGQVVYSEEGDGEAFSEAGTVMGVGARADYDSTLNDKAISAAISKLVDNVIGNLMDRPWRAYVLAYEDGSYLISGGKSQGIREGDVFGVYRRGKKVRNPQTGLTIELPGQLLGRIKVTALQGDDPNSEISVCSLESGAVPADDFNALYVQP